MFAAAAAAAAKSIQSSSTLCDPRDSSPPGSSVHRILQARILEWVSISFFQQGVYCWSDYKGFDCFTLAAREHMNTTEESIVNQGIDTLNPAT